MKTKEYVYVITNDAFDGWCKIGLTTKQPEKRLAQYQTAAPFRDYEMPFCQPIDNSKQLETEVHANLRDMGIESRNEWFRMPVGAAVSMVSSAVNDLD